MTKAFSTTLGKVTSFQKECLPTSASLGQSGKRKNKHARNKHSNGNLLTLFQFILNRNTGKAMSILSHNSCIFGLAQHYIIIHPHSHVYSSNLEVTFNFLKTDFPNAKGNEPESDMRETRLHSITQKEGLPQKGWRTCSSTWCLGEVSRERQQGTRSLEELVLLLITLFSASKANTILKGMLLNPVQIASAFKLCTYLTSHQQSSNPTSSLSQKHHAWLFPSLSSFCLTPLSWQVINCVYSEMFDSRS